MQTGTISYFSDARGFGFISRIGAKDIFVHRSGIVNEGGRRGFNVGDTVRFDVAENERGLVAVNVSLA
jgi:CspA family cold shock protein